MLTVPELVIGTTLVATLLLVGAMRMLPRHGPQPSAEASAEQDDVGQTLGEYRLKSLLGVGPRARVYRAVPLRPHSLGEAVAIKIMPCLPEERRRLDRAVRLTREVQHRGLARILDFGTERERCYVVMELVEGQTLRPMVDSGMSVGLVIDLMQQLCLAIGAIHRKGLFHGDLRPENVMVNPRGQVKVTDLGLAPELHLEPSDESLQEASWRGSGSATGTKAPSRSSGVRELPSRRSEAAVVAYLAPEQIQRLECGPAADQYTLGLLAYEMLTSRLPFSSEDPLQVMHWHLCTDPEPASARNANVKPALDRVLARMLEKLPENRYSSVEAAWLALEQAF